MKVSRGLPPWIEIKNKLKSCLGVLSAIMSEADAPHIDKIEIAPFQLL